MERMNEEIRDREKVIRCIENMYSRIFAGLWIYQIIADLIWGIYDKILITIKHVEEQKTEESEFDINPQPSEYPRIHIFDTSYNFLSISPISSFMRSILWLFL